MDPEYSTQIGMLDDGRLLLLNMNEPRTPGGHRNDRDLVSDVILVVGGAYSRFQGEGMPFNGLIPPIERLQLSSRTSATGAV